VRRLFLLAFIWGWSFLFIKVILEDAPPTFLAWGRIALGLAVLMVAMRGRGEPLPERRYWGHLVVMGLAMSALPFLLIGWGEEHISSALASVLNACTPLFAAGFAAALLGERLRPPQLLGVAVGFLGVAVVAGVGGGDLAGSSLLGSAAVVLASAGYGFGFAYANRFTTGLSALQLSFGQLLAATFLLAPVAAADVFAGRVDLGLQAALCLFLLGALPPQLPHPPGERRHRRLPGHLPRPPGRRGRRCPRPRRALLPPPGPRRPDRHPRRRPGPGPPPRPPPPHDRAGPRDGRLRLTGPGQAGVVSTTTWMPSSSASERRSR
jgi:drug/metabolite transporter (DMT)-like permease